MREIFKHLSLLALGLWPLAAHAQVDPFAPVPPQPVVTEYPSGAGELSRRELEMRQGALPGVAGTFGDPWNLRGVRAARVVVELAGFLEGPRRGEALRSELENLMAGWLQNQGLEAPRPSPWRGEGDDQYVQDAGHAPAPRSWDTHGTAFLIPRRPFLGEEPEADPWPTQWNHPLAPGEEMYPGLNLLRLRLTLEPFGNGYATLTGQLSFERSSAGRGHWPGVVWQGPVLQQMVLPWPTGSDLWPVARQSLGLWWQEATHASANPQLLGDAARLPGPHRVPLAPHFTQENHRPLDLDRQDPFWREHHQANWRTHGLDNQLCDGAGRRFAPPAPGETDPCWRYPVNAPDGKSSPFSPDFLFMEE